MLFNSYEFIFGFLPLLLLACGLLGRWQARRALVGTLVVASLVYYSWWSWRYLGLIAFSILFNFGWAHFLQTGWPAHPSVRPARSRAILALGIAVNLGLLGYFKYAAFVVRSLDAGLGLGWPVPAIVLPLGISFFTFEQITYLVDAYRGESPKHDFLSYSLFVTFFPHLFAGPIVRPRDLIPQFTEGGRLVPSQEHLTTGLFVFAIGIFKKVYLADMFGRWVGPIFDQATQVPFADAWAATLAFVLQVYFDFSGYSDMAIGLAGMLNIHLPENFDSPYKATSIIDFWRRWHMTLSRFLRDYVFMPLAGIRGGQLRRYAALVFTMLLCGLWHGANWTFVVFGGLHGVYLAINHLWRHLDIRLPRLPCWFLTFVAVLFSFVFFRAQSFARAGVLLRGMAGLSGFGWDPTPNSLRRQTHRLLGGLFLVTCCPNRQEIMEWRWASDLAYAAAFALLAGLSILQLSSPAPFVYFQF